jgi:hypothetical protein
MKVEFQNSLWKNTQVSNVMIILAGEAKLFHVAGQTDMLN